MEKTVEVHQKKDQDARTVVVFPVHKHILSSTVLIFLEQGEVSWHNLLLLRAVMIFL
jgi:hypothetical protein